MAGLGFFCALWALSQAEIDSIRRGFVMEITDPAPGDMTYLQLSLNGRFKFVRSENMPESLVFLSGAFSFLGRAQQYVTELCVRFIFAAGSRNSILRETCCA